MHQEMGSRPRQPADPRQAPKYAEKRGGNCYLFITAKTGNGLDQVTVQGGCPNAMLPQPVFCWAKAVIKPFCTTKAPSAAAITVRTIFV
jgi:hypothetical protein